jgi:tripartite-type tricarboxylate transporter receptor subunit TctC
MADVPTLREAGVAGYRAEAWLGLLGPAGLSRDIVMRLGSETARVLRRPDVGDRLVELGSEPVGSTPEEFAAYLRDEYARYGKLVKAAGIRLD